MSTHLIVKFRLTLIFTATKIPKIVYFSSFSEFLSEILSSNDANPVHNINDSVKKSVLDLQEAVFAHTSGEFNFRGGRSGGFGLKAGAGSTAADLQTTRPVLVKNAELTSR